MRRARSFVRKTRKGAVVNVIKEHYLRDDIPCGHPRCQACQPLYTTTTTTTTTTLLSPTSQLCLVLDTNVVLHQLDLLEVKDGLCNVIILQTVLEETKHRNIAAYDRLRLIISDEYRHFVVFSNEHHRNTYVEKEREESPNDRNDRAIRAAVKWLHKHLHELCTVLLLTDDRANLEHARREGIYAKTIHQHVHSLQRSDLLDRLAEPIVEGEKKMVEYPEYKSMQQLEQLVKTGEIHQGPIRVSRENLQEAFVPCEKLDADILIKGREHINRAVDGDIVAVELLPESEWTQPSVRLVESDVHGGEEEEEEEGIDPEVRGTGDRQPSGKVVGVIRRKERPYCGSLDLRSKRGDTYLFVPVNKKIPRIRIRTRQAETLKGKRIVVVMDAWERTDVTPSGHYVQTIGEIGDRDTESEVLLVEHDVPLRPFTNAALGCLPSAPWSISTEEVKRRRDLRDTLIFSVDPPGCVDIDDALSIRTLSNGHYEVGVHIADVTHFVTADSALDLEARERGTTVYLVEKRIDMLPGLLGENLCSLHQGVDRLAFSVTWEMTRNAEILREDFFKSIIRSKASLSYPEAQMRMDDLNAHDSITLALRDLNRLAKTLRKERVDSGSLTLASPEVKFAVDAESKDALDVGVYELREANALVEEFMLLANTTVAKRILSHYPQCSLLRRHPPPPSRNFDALKRLAESRGVTLNCDTNKDLSVSLDGAVIADNSYFNTLLRIIATRCMQQAVYFSSGTLPHSDYYHYGLAIPVYTHFTSPIRRYADVVTHRLLAAALGIERLSNDLQRKEGVRRVCERLNFRHRMAQYAQRASVDLHTFLFFRGKSVEEEAYVIKVLTNAFVVLVPRYGIEGSIYLPDSTSPDGFTFDNRNLALTSRSCVIRVFDRVIVQISTDESQQEHYAIKEVEEIRESPKRKTPLWDDDLTSPSASDSGYHAGCSSEAGPEESVPVKRSKRGVLPS